MAYQTTNRGVELIKEHEGLRLTKYLDAVGKPTIGYGHLILPGENYQRITREQAESLFEVDLDIHEREVARLVTVPLNNNQFSALVSFTFNLGPTKLSRSTLLKKLNAGDYAGAAREFSRWVYGKVGGKNKRLAGLIRRRADEKSLFLTPGQVEPAPVNLGHLDSVDVVAPDAVIEPVDAAITELSTGGPLAESGESVGAQPNASPSILAQAGQIVSSPDSPARKIITGNTGAVAKPGAVLAILTAVWNWIETHPGLVVTVIVCGTLVFLAVYFREFLEKKIEAAINGDPYKHNVEFVRRDPARPIMGFMRK